MKKAIYIFFLFFICAPVHSQAYFNFRFEFDQPGWWDGATNVFQLPDGYIIGGGSAYYSPFRMGFYKIGFQGNRIFSRIYSDTVDEYYLGNPGSIVRFNDTMIIASGSRNSPVGDWIYQEGLIYFLDNEFDTLFTASFCEKTPPVDTSYLLYQLKKTFNNHVIAVGNKKPDGLESKILLIQTDIQGGLLWERTYGYGGSYWQGHSVVCTSDGGYAIGGFAWAPSPPPNLTGDPIVVKTDSAGNLEWFENYGTQYIDSRGMICSTQDGNMIVGFGFCDSMDQSHPYRRINLIKIDNGGNTIWSKKFCESSLENTLLNVRENPDGTIISIGTTTKFFPTAYKYVGWILKTTSDGDSLWYRQYDICKGESTWNWLYDVIETPDKGYLACGVVYPEPPDTGSQDCWILKVDSLGCERMDYCWVGMKPEPLIPENTTLEIFPNPAEEQTVISIKPTGYINRIKIVLYDFFSKEVKTIDLMPGQTQFRLDVSELPDGMYYVIVSQGDKIRICRKLIKQSM